MRQNAWLIPLIPLIAFIIILFVGKRFKEKSALIGIFAVGISFILSLLILSEVIQKGAIAPSITWFKVGSATIDASMVIDPLAAVMFIVVTLVSLMVQIYSMGYMRGEKRYNWYFAALSLFTAAMLELVTAGNILLLYIGWEMVGLCSYLLIGFWFEKKSASNAAIKAFITTKTGDVGFIIGLTMLFLTTGTLNIPQITKIVAGGGINPTLLTVITILIFCGAVGKSAQFPLHVWLPDAMEGPTPVSALIHAATMVAAGVYLVARFFTIFQGSPQSLLVVAYIGTITAFMAATMAMVEYDIKRVIAYSTISQLGLMMLGLGVGAYTASVFHLMTHAFFKSLLFLGSGCVIHALATNDMREMGGLSKKMKITAATFIIGSLSLSGIFPLAGFWSKDEILTKTYESGHYFIFVVGLIVAFMTAFYITRAFSMTFFGQPRQGKEGHEAPLVMTIPCMILAFLSIVAGFIGFPSTKWGLIPFISLEKVHQAPLATIISLMILSTVVAVSGILLALAIYWKKWLSVENLKKKLSFAYQLVVNKYYFDHIYIGGIIRFIVWFSRVLLGFDLKIIDGAVNATAEGTLVASSSSGVFDLRVIDGIVNGVAITTDKGGQILKFTTSGDIQRYALVLFASVAILVIVLIYL